MAELQMPATAAGAVVIANDAIFRAKRRLGIITLLIPVAGVLGAAVLAYFRGISGLDIILLGGMYILTMAGVEVGFHRQLSHNAFECPKWVQVSLAALGSAAMQGGVLYWVATHRRHHIHSDTPKDPHSPYYRLGSQGPETLGWLRGLWHSQLSNLYTDHATNVPLFVKDLLKNRALATVNKLYPHCVIGGLLIPTLIAGIWTHSGWGAVEGFLWGGLVRIFLVHQVYFANGSFSHMYGARPFDNGDKSSNNRWFAIPTFGSAYQNNHHAFPAAARIGLTWWQVDVGYLIIRSLQALGLASHVKRATAEQIATKLQRAVARRAARNDD